MKVDESTLVVAADGNQRRLALGLPDAGAILYGNQEGAVGGTRGSGAVHVGVVEVEDDDNGDPNRLNLSHPAFEDGLGNNRVRDTEMCKLRAFERKCTNSAVGTIGSHGTKVASTLLADLTLGQDPNYSSSAERVKRSGIARSAEMTYYLVSRQDSYANVATAIEAATFDDEVDIVTMSLSEPATSDRLCSNEDYAGVRSAIRAAENAGMLVIVASGNNGEEVSGCSVSSHATIPDTVAVGATDDVTTLAGLETVGVWSKSSRGTFTAVLDGGSEVSARIIDLVVNGKIHLWADGADTYGSTGSTGTSYAAPQVAGAAVMLKTWLDNYFLEDDYGSVPYALRAFLSVMGDGAAGASGGGQNSYTVDTTTGFGHLRFVDLEQEVGSLGTWGFGGGSPLVLTEGEMRQWPVGNTSAESSSIKGWKFAALIDYDYYDGGPDIRFELVDRCPAGGGEQVVKTAREAPLKARMRMSSADEMEEKYHGRCLWIRATAEHLPNATVTIWAADYYYSNPRASHDMGG